MEGALDRLRLHVAYTMTYFHGIHNAESPGSAVCKISETVHHTFYQCLIYDRERQDLIHALSSLDSRSFTITEALGAWLSQDMAARASKVIAHILRAAQNATLL